MARTKVNEATEAVTPIKGVEVKETTSVANAEPIKKYIIANKPVQMHSKPNLLQASATGAMLIGTAYEIKDETKNVYGAFYKLDNGLYVSKNEQYTIY